MLRSIHGFKNRNGHRTVFLKNFGSTPFFDRCWLVLRLLTGPDCSWFPIEPVRPTSLVRFLKQWKYPRYIFVLFCFVLIFVFILVFEKRNRFISNFHFRFLPYFFTKCVAMKFTSRSRHMFNLYGTVFNLSLPSVSYLVCSFSLKKILSFLSRQLWPTKEKVRWLG